MDRLASEKRLIFAALVLVALMNVPVGRYVLYPFMIFSTWIHEMCHGLAALIIGGSIDKLEVFPDGSGLAYTRRPANSFAMAWVASAGYIGTAVIGSLMLLFRRRKRAGQIGLGLLAVAMILSVVLYIRNGFGMGSILAIGIALGAMSMLREEISGWIYTFLAATCCLNAITSINVLFSANLMVDGKAAGGSDAHTVADALWLPYWFWAVVWVALAVVLTGASLYYAPGGIRAAQKKKKKK